jgi:hypothetical protein
VSGPVDFWERSRVGWHAAWYGVLAVTAVAVLALSSAPLADRLTGVAALAAAAALYLAVGARLLGDRCSLPRYAVYAAGTTACLVVLALALSPGSPWHPCSSSSRRPGR